jgi:hypothetical protein
MTTLPIIADRNALNIDTHERALVYSALLLRKANTTLTDTKYKNAVRVTTSETQNTDLSITAKVIIEAKIPYNSQSALGYGGNFIENLISFSPVNPSFLLTEPLTSNNTNLGDDPEFVINLEKYFAFHALQWQKAIINDHTLKVFDYCKVQFFEEDTTEPSVKLSVSIPYNYSDYVVNRNLLQSINNIAVPITYSNNTYSPFIGDATNLDDSYYLGD